MDIPVKFVIPTIFSVSSYIEYLKIKLHCDISTYKTKQKTAKFSKILSLIIIRYLKNLFLKIKDPETSYFRVIFNFILFLYRKLQVSKVKYSAVNSTYLNTS